ncbi:MAG: biosynthetic peptidoglycan transglycosylase [Kofleriaceae bacterium]
MRPDVAPGGLGAGALTARRLADERLTIAGLILAVAVPVGAARYLDHQVHQVLEPALTRATGVPTRVGGFEAGLTGNVTLRHIAVGDLITSDEIEASVSLDSLLAGQLSPDEIRVREPKVRAIADRDGRQAWRQVLARLAARKAPHGHGGGRHRLRRVVVTGGDLVAAVDGVRVRAKDVEFHPAEGGVRIVTGAISISATRGGATLDGSAERLGADVRLPELTVERAALVGGSARVALAGPTMALADLVVIHDRPDGPWRVTGTVDDAGVPRPITLVAATGRDGRAVAISGDRIPLAVLDRRWPALGLAAAHASGQLTIGRGAVDEARGTLAVAGVSLTHPAVADGPLPIDATITFAARRAGDRIDLDALEVRRGDVAVRGAAWLRLGPRGPIAGAVTAALAPASCRAVVDAFPAPLRGHLDQLAVRGTLSGAVEARLDLEAELGDGVELAVTGDDQCQVVADSPDADPRRLTEVFEHRFPDGTVAPVGPGVGDWVDLAHVPAYVAGAFVAAEDARFYQHHGFDLTQIGRSLEIDLREDRIARGGSTISQQLVKNAFLHQGRTLARKLEEAVLTWRLEAVLTKADILARYLNVIELGPGVFGVGAAARHWFGRAPADLTVRQAAFLAALTPAPRTISARLQTGHRLDPDTEQRVAVVLRAMRRAGVIDAATARAAAGAALELRPAALGR